MWEPEDAQIGQSRQVSHFLQVTNVVLSDVDLLQFGAVGQVFKSGHLVMGERNNLQVGKLPQHVQIVNLEQAKIYIL